MLFILATSFISLSKTRIIRYSQSKTIIILANKLKLQLPLAIVYAYAYTCYICANYVKLMCYMLYFHAKYMSCKLNFS